MQPSGKYLPSRRLPLPRSLPLLLSAPTYCRNPTVPGVILWEAPVPVPRLRLFCPFQGCAAIAASTWGPVKKRAVNVSCHWCQVGRTRAVPWNPQVLPPRQPWHYGVG